MPAHADIHDLPSCSKQENKEVQPQMNAIARKYSERLPSPWANRRLPVCLRRGVQPGRRD
jgi:hypothetical protein